MSYLLIDLEKSATKLHQISPEAGAVYVFTKRKRSQKLAQQFAKQHRAVKVIHTAKNEKLSDNLAKKLRKILKKDPCAGIVVVSSRQKVAKLMDKLLNRYLEAEMILLDKEQKNQSVVVDNVPKLLEKPVDLPLLVAPHDEPCQQPETENLATTELAYLSINALNLLKKNQPKKKNALMQILRESLRLDDAQVAKLIEELLLEGEIQIDAAENVKYR
ncbi:hypothetical protein JF634_05455 [Simonsiella muelleri]|uniref:PIN-like domain-containing protein n=1 Tax=Simonsiella muelleri ATCC 29453 TaxID=641147 RepID=V9H5H7_9NEIS|nr:hypothetical protein [Simonsiella muelleri]AUX60865.1 hypothetical protein BWP33_02830 [Simonsiella muelleri ATCC 29453]EFG30116.1 hypothetical protein HMPREF9021_02021 [Simonsiella muelleri ATCC 29453]UBQ54920.1 hypothetical protein JF634_05455 [Simonsiella muelleri]